MSGIGGYVRRCERKPYYEPRRRWESSPFELFYQSMPILHFEPFVIAEDDTGMYLDAGGMEAVRSWYEQHPR